MCPQEVEASSQFHLDAPVLLGDAVFRGNNDLSQSNFKIAYRITGNDRGGVHVIACLKR
jgi:hypothetical protein